MLKVSLPTKEFFKSSVIYGVTELVKACSYLILLPFYICYLRLSQIGTVTLFETLRDLLGLILGLGIPFATIRYCEHSDYKAGSVLSTGLLATFFISLIAGLVIGLVGPYFLGNYMQYRDKMTFVVYGFQMVCSMMSAVFSGVWRIRNEPFRYAIQEGLFTFVTFFGIVFVLLIAKDKIFGIISVQALAFFIAVSYGIITLRNSYSKPRWDYFRQLIKYGSPMIFHKIGLRTSNYGDRFFIQAFVGSAALGLYAIAAKIAGAISIVIGVFQLGWQPFIIRYADKEDGAHHITFVGRAYVLVIFFVAVLVSLFGARFVNFFAQGKNYAGVEKIIPVLSLGLVLYTCYLVSSFGMMLREKTYYLPIATLSAASVNVILNLILMPIFGLVGAAWATVGGYSIMFIVARYFSIRLYPTRIIF